MKKIKLILFPLVLLFSFVLLGSVVQVKAERKTVDVEIVTYFDEDNQFPTKAVGKAYGTKFKFNDNLDAGSGYEFSFWIVNGKVRKDLALDNEFVVTDNMSIKGVFKPTGKHAVVFMDANGDVLKVQHLDTGANADDLDITTLPDKPGYEVAVSKWDKDLTNVQADTVFTLQYTRKVDADTPILTVEGGTVNGETEDIFGFNEVVTVVANAPAESKHFSHWLIGKNIVSRISTYSFSILKDTTITAVYADAAPADLPLVAISDKLTIREGYNSFMGQFYIPEGYTLIEYGMLASNLVGKVTFDTPNVLQYKGNKYFDQTNEWLMSFKNTGSSNFRSYLICENNVSKELITVYNDKEEASSVASFVGDYTSAAAYISTQSAGWTQKGTNSTGSGYFELKNAGDNIQSQILQGAKGPISIKINAWASLANGTQTFIIDGYDSSNNIVGTSGNISLATAGFASSYKDYTHILNNVNGNISYIRFTYNKESSGINLRVPKITISYNQTEATPSKIVITGANEVLQGNSITLVASVDPSIVSQNVTWTSSNSAVATVDQTGKVTGVSAGVVTITASSVSHPAVAKSVEITVQGLDQVKADAKAEIDDYITLLEIDVYYSSTDIASINDFVNAAKTDIDNALSMTEINAIVDEAMLNIDSVRTIDGRYYDAEDEITAYFEGMSYFIDFDLELPVSEVSHVEYKWTFSPNGIFDNNTGVFTQPDNDTIVTVTIDIYIDGVKVNESLTQEITALAAISDNDLYLFAIEDMDAKMPAFNTEISADMTLPSGHPDYTKVTYVWTSQKPEAISNTGKYMGPATNTSVTLIVEVFNGETNIGNHSYTVIAKAQVKYTVTFNVDGGSAVADQLVIEGKLVEKPENPTKDGYKFVKWCSDAELGTEYVFTDPVTANITLYATWEVVVAEKTVTITQSTTGIATYSTTEKTFDLDGITYGAIEIMKKSGSGVIQGRASTMRLYNITSLGKIKNIVITFETSKDTYTVYAGNASKAETTAITPQKSGAVHTFDFSSGNYDFFTIKNGSSAVYITSIEITYQP